MQLPIISNFLLRIENADHSPHHEVEDVGAPHEKIYVKDYDVFLFRDETDVCNAMADAIRLASEVTEGRKFLHITICDESFPLRIPPDMLKSLADSGCSLEVYVDQPE